MSPHSLRIVPCHNKSFQECTLRQGKLLCLGLNPPDQVQDLGQTGVFLCSLQWLLAECVVSAAPLNYCRPELPEAQASGQLCGKI